MEKNISIISFRQLLQKFCNVLQHISSKHFCTYLMTIYRILNWFKTIFSYFSYISLVSEDILIIISSEFLNLFLVGFFVEKLFNLHVCFRSEKILTFFCINYLHQSKLLLFHQFETTYSRKFLVIGMLIIFGDYISSEISQQVLF